MRVGLSSDHTQNTQCGSPLTSSQVLAGQWTEVNCNEPILGQYISAEIEDGKAVALTLCEVEAYEGDCLTTPKPTTSTVATTLPSTTSVGMRLKATSIFHASGVTSMGLDWANSASVRK